MLRCWDAGCGLRDLLVSQEKELENRERGRSPSWVRGSYGGSSIPLQSDRRGWTSEGKKRPRGLWLPGAPGAVLFWKEGESYAAKGASPLRTEKLPSGLGLEGGGPSASVLGEEPDGPGLRSECAE